jgi:hypothetical protein
MFISLLLLLSIIDVARAETNLEKVETYNTVSKFEIGLQLHSFNYAEELVLPAKSKETGFIPGITIAHSIKYSPEFSLFTTLELAIGSTKYDGSLQSIGGRSTVITPHVSTSNNSILNIEMLPALNIFQEERTSLDIYLGLGFHYWFRGAGLADKYGYPEYYSWFYFPLGAKLNVGISKDLKIGLDATLKMPFIGTIIVQNSYYNPQLADSRGSLGGRFGYRLQMPIVFLPENSFQFKINPYVEYSGIGEGSTFIIQTKTGGFVDYAHEPASNNYLYGLAVSAIWNL